MFRNITTQSHHAKSHVSMGFQPSQHDLLQVGSQSRRWFLQAGLSGLAGLSTADLLRLQARAGNPDSKNNRKSVILFWLSGGPSHIDMWDPKPDATDQIRGPFGTIQTRLPGVRFSEHLPRQAAMLDKMTVIRSVDWPNRPSTPSFYRIGRQHGGRCLGGR